MDWVHNIHILSWVAYLPMLGALVIVFAFKKDQGPSIRKFATGVAFFDFLLSLALWYGFDPSGELFQFRESHTWIETIGVRYEFGIDGIALLWLTFYPAISAVGGAQLGWRLGKQLDELSLYWFW